MASRQHALQFGFLVALVAYLVTGNAAVLVPAGVIVVAKLVLDLAFHLWSVRLYRNWVGERTGAHAGLTLLAALIEPFSFQILRHAGAAWGWLVFLTGTRHWGKQHRVGLATSDETDNATQDAADEATENAASPKLKRPSA